MVSTYKCCYCGTQCTYDNRKKNCYCSNRCQRAYQWYFVTKPKLEHGEYGGKPSRLTLIRYIIERDGYKCSSCKVDSWNGKYIALDVDHIDGDNQNHSVENLRFLCPNCHRQTTTWGNQRGSKWFEQKVLPIINKGP